MKYKVIGLKTEKVYYESNTRSSCYKKITEDFPYSYGEHHKSLVLDRKQVLPEPLMVIGPRVTKAYVKLTQNELRLSNKM